MPNRLPIAGLILLLLAALDVPLRGATDDERFLEGLRQRRLFSLAEMYCGQRLADVTLTDLQRGQLTIEQIRCFAQHAMNETADRRAPLWEKARQTAAEFLDQYPDHPRRVLIRVQDALTLLAQGELKRMEAEMGAGGSTALDRARDTIRAAVRALEAIARGLGSASPQSATDTGTLDEAEFRALEQHVRVQWARALRNLALCYPAASSDRVAALTQALEKLEQALLQIAPDDPLAWRVRIDQIVASRLSGDLAGAAAASGLLDAFPEEDVPVAIRLQKRAEEIRLMLTAGEERALELLKQGREIDGSTSPELDFAFLETYVALWRAAADQGDTAAASKWRDLSVAAVKQVEHMYGRYWGRRADLLLVEAGRGRSSGSVDILERTANELYGKKQFDEALASYDDAAEAASALSDHQKAFELRYKAALLQQQRSLYADAGQRFRELALASKQDSRAANAHLLAAVNVAQQTVADRQVLPKYVDVLKEHSDNWPRSETASTARLWLGKLLESQQDWAGAVASYRQISAAAPVLSESLPRAADCWSRRLSELRDRGQETQGEAETAAEYFEEVERSEAAAAELAELAAVTAARIRLLFSSPDYGDVERKLNALLARRPADAEPGALRRWLVLAQAGQPGREDEALRTATELGEAAPELLDVLHSLASMAASTSDADRRAALSAVQLKLIDTLAPAAPSWEENDRLRLQQTQARALADSGNRARAVDLMAELARGAPQNLRVQRAYGQLLLDGKDPDSWQVALEQWRRIASRTKPRTTAWFRAKYNVALSQLLLGDKASAAKLIRYLQLTENLGDSEMEAEFAELLRRSEK